MCEASGLCPFLKSTRFLVPLCSRFFTGWRLHKERLDVPLSVAYVQPSAQSLLYFRRLMALRTKSEQLPPANFSAFW